MNPLLQDYTGWEMDCSEEYAEDDPSIPSTGTSGIKRRKDQPQSSAKKTASSSSKLFQASWLEDSEFKGWLRAVPTDKTAAICIACNKTLNGGKSDLQKHAATAKHQKCVSSIQGCKSISQVFAAGKCGAMQKHKRDVQEMEIALSAYISEHNTAFLNVEHLVGVLKKRAHDSQIVKDLTLGRDKCAAIIKNVIAPTETEDLVKDLQQVPFAVLIDETTDVGNDKVMTILTRHTPPSSSKPITCVLELVKIDAHDCSGESLWNAFESCLNKHQIPLQNIVGLACDNASVMTGIRNSFWSRMKVACPHAILFPCICHSSAIISQRACSSLPSFVLDSLRRMSSFLNGSPKRCSELRDFQVRTLRVHRIFSSILQFAVPVPYPTLHTLFCFQELYKVEIHNVLRPATTRWLVLHPCVVQFIKQHDCFLGFFRTFVRENPNDQDAQKILKDISYSMTLAYMHFLDFSLGLFYEFNALFQSEGVLIHSLVDRSRKLLTKFCQNFLKSTEVDRIETTNVAHPSNFVSLLTFIVLCPGFIFLFRLIVFLGFIFCFLS